MLEGQSKGTRFLRLFEAGWHLQIAEWLRSDDYADGMPSTLRTRYEGEIAGGIENWQDELSKAKNEVIVNRTRTGFLNRALT